MWILTYLQNLLQQLHDPQGDENNVGQLIDPHPVIKDD